MAYQSSQQYGPRVSPVDRAAGHVHTFWQRVTAGLELQELWGQFKADARAGYALYSKEVDWEPVAGEPKGKRFWRIVKALFWAMVMKLSPARRVVLVLSLLFVILGIIPTQVNVSDHTQITVGGGKAIVGALGLLVLLALELADRVTMKRDLEIAKEIQQWLVPDKPPVIPGVEIAFASRAANTVAGDYYDAFLRVPESSRAASVDDGTDGRRLLVVVADVAGKSVPAALLMATFQASLRTLAREPTSLLDLVAGLNAYACEHSHFGRRFTTAFFAELDRATSRLIYVNAGHNQPMLMRAGGGLDRLGEGGLPLGIMRDASYQSAETTLGSGDRLFIFTDGVVEAEDAGTNEFGEARLLAQLQLGRESRAADALQRLMTSIEAFVGHAPQHDDITCLVLDRK